MLMHTVVLTMGSEKLRERRGSRASDTEKR